MKKLVIKFIKIDEIPEDLCQTDVTNKSIHQSLENVFVGVQTRQLVEELLEYGEIDLNERNVFYGAVFDFYVAAAQYAIEKLPFEDKVLQNAKLLNVPLRRRAQFSQVEHIIKRFPNIIQYSPSDIDKLHEEFAEYQLLKDEEVPSDVRENAVSKKDKDGKALLYRMDVIWAYLGQMKAPDGNFVFEKLSKIALLVLSLPHSNAEEERVFSMIGKNKRVERSSLSIDGTLSSIIMIKMADLDAKKYQHPKSVTKESKSSTYKYNQEHKN